MTDRDTPNGSLGQLAAFTLVVGVLLGAGYVDVALGQYNNTSVDYWNDTDDGLSDVDNGSWEQGRNATLNNTLNTATRVVTFVVGTGNGVASQLMGGLLVFGAVIAVVGSSALGFVGGGVAGVVTIFALTMGGLSPVWLYAIVMAAVGVTATLVVRRVLG